MMADATQKRCGFITLLGAPNVGKSTLLNTLVGQKISIVTPKVQTTRSIVRGVAIEGDAQLIFIDTPGIFATRRQKRLEQAMVDTAWSGASEADMILFLIDAKKGLDKESKHILETLKSREEKAVLILNKIDVTPREKLLTLAQELNDTGIFTDIFMISALKDDGVADIKKHLASHAPESVWLFPEDQVSDAPKWLLAAETTREQLFLQLQQELPYELTVETEDWHERKDGSVEVRQMVYVTRESHKKILLGKGGQRIKHVGEKARKELTRQFEQKIHLFLFVKVRENWQENPDRYHAMGLDFPK